MIGSLIHSVRYRWALHRIRRIGIWFVDIPRTSSSSVRIALQNQLGSAYAKGDLGEKHHNSYQSIPSHLPARDMQARLGAGSWHKIFTFSLVRNPWDRMWSMYNYRRACGELMQTEFEQYLELLFKEPAHEPESPYNYHGHYYQCLDYLTDDQGKLMVDFVGRYENRQQDLQHVAAQCGLKDLSALHLNRLSAPGDYRQHYSQRARELVARWAAKDIAFFNYTF